VNLRYLLGAVALVDCLISAPANACSIVVDPNQTYADRLKNVRQEIDRATAIIDGEVVRAGSSGSIALLYAHRVLKGPNQHWFYVLSGTGGDCRREFSQVGERARLFLYQDRDGLTADSGMDPSLEDRILRSDRRKLYPYFSGPRRPASAGSNE